MHKLRIALALLVSTVVFDRAWAPTAIAAQPVTPVTEAAGRAVGIAAQNEHEAGQNEGLPLHAVEIVRIGSFPITNSMLVSWIVAIGLIVFAQRATRNIQAVPSGLQNFWEWLVEGLYGLLEGIIGHELVKKTFWFFATIFIFILFGNWFGLIPFVGTVGWKLTMADGSTQFLPWFRGANADLNMTFAMASIFFVCWIVWALQTNGPGGFLLHLFGPKGDTTGWLRILMIFVFLAVGVLEVVSILFRPVSLSFRLFGNIYAGENMLEAMKGVMPGWLGSIIVPIPFYFLEVLVGLVQALVFMLLTSVFTLLICTHEEGHQTIHH